MDLEIKEIYLCASASKEKEYAHFIKELRNNFVVKNFEEVDANKESIVIVIGGDGSLNYILNNIDNFKNIKIIYFACGTANDFAKSIKLVPLEPTLSLVKEILSLATTISLPIMKCNEKRFINVATAGAPARVTQSGSDLIKKYAGKVSYYLSALEELVSPIKTSIDYSCDNGDEVSQNVFGFIVSQGLFAGGGVKVTPRCTPSFSESFSFVTMDSKSLASSMATLMKLQPMETNVEIDDDNLIVEQVSNLKVKAKENIEVKLDGEEYTAKELIFKKEKESLTFYFY